MKMIRTLERGVSLASPSSSPAFSSSSLRSRCSAFQSPGWAMVMVEGRRLVATTASFGNAATGEALVLPPAAAALGPPLPLPLSRPMLPTSASASTPFSLPLTTTQAFSSAVSVALPPRRTLFTQQRDQNQLFGRQTHVLSSSSSDLPSHRPGGGQPTANLRGSSSQRQPRFFSSSASLASASRESEIRDFVASLDEEARQFLAQQLNAVAETGVASDAAEEETRPTFAQLRAVCGHRSVWFPVIHSTYITVLLMLLLFFLSFLSLFLSLL